MVNKLNKLSASHEAALFYFVLFWSSPMSFPRLNHLRKVRQRFPHSILFFSDQKVASCSVFLLSKGDSGSLAAAPGSGSR